MNLKDPFNAAGQSGGKPEDRKVLHPLFGSYCRGINLSVPGGQPGERVYVEAFQDDQSKKTWTVCKVTISPGPGGAPRVKAEPIKTRQSFTDALGWMIAFERQMAETGSTALFPEAEHMGYLHYAAFAEREGYIFATNGLPYARPAAAALPPEQEFDAAAIRSANERLARPDAEFNNNGPASRQPAAHFLFDHLLLASTRSTENGADAREEKVVAILDRYADALQRAQDKITEYCTSYHDTKRGYLMKEAEDSFDTAAYALRQLKVYGVDTTAFDSFLEQSRIATQMIHAKALYNIMLKGAGGVGAYYDQFRQKYNDAATGLARIDKSPDALALLKTAVQKGDEPQPPASNGLFLSRYRSQRSHYGFFRNKPPAPPAP